MFAIIWLIFCLKYNEIEAMLICGCSILAYCYVRSQPHHEVIHGDPEPSQLLLRQGRLVFQPAQYWNSDKIPTKDKYYKLQLQNRISVGMFTYGWEWQFIIIIEEQYVLSIDRFLLLDEFETSKDKLKCIYIV